MRDERTSQYFGPRLRASDSIEPQGLCYALDIERDHAPDKWAAEIEKIPDEHRERAASYLRERYRCVKQFERDAPLRAKLERLRAAGFKA